MYENRTVSFSLERKEEKTAPESRKRKEDLKLGRDAELWRGESRPEQSHQLLLGFQLGAHRCL